MYFYYDIDEGELYDLKKDSHEIQNVCNGSAYSEVRKNLHQKLDELRNKNKDSDENDQRFIKSYLSATSKKKKACQRPGEGEEEKAEWYK